MSKSLLFLFVPYYLTVMHVCIVWVENETTDHLDMNAVSDYMHHPFSVRSIADMHSDPSFSAYVFACLHGEKRDICASMIEEVSKEKRRRQYQVSWEIMMSYKIVSILGICLVMLILVVISTIKTWRERQFYYQLVL